MTLFKYSEIDAKGKKKKGQIDALSMSDAKAKLREQGLMVTSLSLNVSKRERRRFSH